MIVRDLRDVLVSAYFSIRYSHPSVGGGEIPMRQELNELSAEEGMLLLIERWLPDQSNLQWSWVASKEQVIRYEDLLVHDTDILERVLYKQCGLGADRAQVESVVRAHRFEAWTGGRVRGEENVHSHERKGVPGDWKNHFTPKVKVAFKDLYGSLLIANGYSDGFDW